MQLQLPALTGDIPGVAYTFSLAGIVAATIVSYKLFKYHQLDGIPTVGSSSWFGSWRAGHKFDANVRNLIQEGYRKYKTLPFKIADSHHWIVIVSSRQHVEELRKAPDDALSFLEEINKSFKTDQTLAPETIQGPYQMEFIRTQLSRNLGNLYSEIQEEVLAAFDDVLDLRNDEWKSVPALSAVQQIVCRVSNRMFVGLPLCRDPDWININLGFALNVFYAGNKINRFPSFLSPMVVRFMTDVPDCKERAAKLLAPVVEERLKLLEEHGTDWPDKPTDYLSWLLEEVPEGVGRTVMLLTTRMLTINVASIHNSTTSFAHALFFLAENPQYIQPLREEVEAIVETEGWSKASLSKMPKIDSFLKESQRMTGTSILSLRRLAVKDFTFSDGTFIPKGTSLAAPLESLNLDDAHYEHPHVFNPFRFSNMGNGSEGGEETKHRFVSTAPEYLPFGHGKHACPGRFFASDELKFMLAHIVVTYDVKLEDNKPRPEVFRFGIAMSPNPFANVMFRKRAD